VTFDIDHRVLPDARPDRQKGHLAAPHAGAAVILETALYAFQVPAVITRDEDDRVSAIVGILPNLPAELVDIGVGGRDRLEINAEVSLVSRAVDGTEIDECQRRMVSVDHFLEGRPCPVVVQAHMKASAWSVPVLEEGIQADARIPEEVPLPVDDPCAVLGNPEPVSVVLEQARLLLDPPDVVDDLLHRIGQKLKVPRRDRGVRGGGARVPDVEKMGIDRSQGPQIVPDVGDEAVARILEGLAATQAVDHHDKNVPDRAAVPCHGPGSRASQGAPGKNQDTEKNEKNGRESGKEFPPEDSHGNPLASF